MSRSVTCFLLVGQLDKALVRLFDLRRVEVVPELAQALPKGVAARVLAEDQPALGHADGLGRHDLVGAPLLQHPVLVDARLVREGVFADDRLVGLHGDAGERADEPARAVDVLRDDAAYRLCSGRCGRRSAMTISSREALPARSPRPLIVHSTCAAPAVTAASELATARPRSSWQWTLMTAFSIPGVFSFRYLMRRTNSSGVV